MPWFRSNVLSFDMKCRKTFTSWSWCLCFSLLSLWLIDLSFHRRIDFVIRQTTENDVNWHWFPWCLRKSFQEYFPQMWKNASHIVCCCICFSFVWGDNIILLLIFPCYACCCSSLFFCSPMWMNFCTWENCLKRISFGWLFPHLH